VHNGFNGGYYLHSRLPYTVTDHYFFDGDNDIFVLQSGSVYNRSDLESTYNINVAVPDPELVARLFLSKGPEVLSELIGDLAIFLCQPARKEAILFRDHVGIRPLGWIIDRNTLFFSTDITGLCREFSGGQEVNSDYLLSFFKFIDKKKTPFEKVKKLLPGHYIHFSVERTEMVKYWEPEKIKTDNTLSFCQTISDLKALVSDTVKIRSDGRFCAGAHVSSGLDSGIVSLLARKEYSGQAIFHGFSWSPFDFTPINVKYDERLTILKLCETGDISPHFSDLKLEDFCSIVSEFYYNQGFFFEDRTIEQVVEYKTNLIFSGWGGDEFISTSERGIGLDLLRGLKIRTFLHRNPVLPIRRFAGYMLFYILYPAMGILGRGVSRSLRNDCRYLKKPYKNSDRDALRNFFFYKSRWQNHIRLLRLYHLQERCENWAINGFRNGVEYRYPLLDKRIIEYVLKIPSKLLSDISLPRPLLSKICEGILAPGTILNLRKNDPVYTAWVEELFKESAVLFMGEVDRWKDNEDLHFVDFDLLETDIERLRNNPDEIDQEVLFRALVYIKAINGFIIKYKERI
jgi:asparagine synthase (glutamine-hydrolysing)